MIRFQLALLGAAVLFLHAGNVIAADASHAWMSKHLRDHRLVGTVWKADGTQVSVAEVMKTIQAADYILLGEINTNPDHHILQAAFISALVTSGRKPAIVFEMIPKNLQPKLDEVQSSAKFDVDDIGPAVQWQQRGWPSWMLYKPIGAVAKDANLKLIAGDIDQQTRQAISKDGLSALSRTDLNRLELRADGEQDRRENLLNVLRSAHCGLLPETAVEKQVAVQQARDAFLADSVLAGAVASGDGAVLIAGSGHVRTDWGVPFYIALRNNSAKIVSVNFTEVSEGVATFRSYAGRDGQESHQSDTYIFFTPKSDLTNPCKAIGTRTKK